MSPTRPTVWLGIAALGCLSLVTGCCQSATLRCWQPPTADVGDIERIAVADIPGEHGADVAAALQARLAQQRGFTLAAPEVWTSAQHAACVACATDAAWLARAKESGLDAVIVGQVQEYRCDDALTEADGESFWSRRHETDDAPGLFAAALSLQGSLQREAVVAIAFRVLDTDTGAVRVEKVVTQRYQGQADDPVEQLPIRSEVLAQLTTECVDEFLQELTPQQVDCEMPLARGGWYGRGAADIRSGNRLAVHGDWDAARDHWQEAIDRYADCDAALYNLALDAAHRQQFDRAEELAMQAIRLRHTDIYAAGLERIRQYRSGHDAVEQRRDSRVLQASIR